MRRVAPLLLLLFAGCVATGLGGAPKLQPGQWVVAKGKIEADRPLIGSISEVPRTPDDKPDKVELLGPTSSASPTQLDLLGATLKPDADTEYENAERVRVDPFVAAPGDWLRVKARSKDEG